MGEVGGNYIHHVTAVEISISAGSNGTGRVQSKDFKLVNQG